MSKQLLFRVAYQAVKATHFLSQDESEFCQNVVLLGRAKRRLIK